MMKITFLILLCSAVVYGQSSFIGRSESVINEGGILKKQTILTPMPNPGGQKNISEINSVFPPNPFNNTAIKWNFTDAAAIGDYCESSGNGKYNLLSWNLNNKRISLYGNATADPLWDFPTSPNGYLNYITISDTGGIIGSGSYQNMYLFNNSSNVPVLNYDLTRLIDTGTATGLDVTGDGKYLVCTVSRGDSSTVFGFNTSSGVPSWSKRIVSGIQGGSNIYGIKLSGNDSLFIVNTYYEYFVFRTYTGQLVYQGLIDGGTQTVQGINGDGSVIAVINYFGLLRVYQWNGTTYNFVFANQEPPGQFYNWYTSVDITYDGEYIAAGTLNFTSSTTVDGKIKVFRKSSGGTPLWTYTGCGDEVSAVSFSKSGNILSASSWGEFNNTTEDLYIFKTYLGNVPIFKLNTTGSMFWCSTSKDGRNVITSGKAVHARQLGSGGLAYDIAVDTTDIPVVSINQINSGVAGEYRLSQNYPNPFNPVTNLEFAISKPGFVSLKVYDALGKEVSSLVNKIMPAGNYKVDFDGSSLNSGVYFYRLKAGDFVQTKQMILIK